MRAVTIENDKGPSSAMRISEVPTPKLPENDPVEYAIVKVRAFGINRLDTLQREGNYPPPAGASEIMGVEFSGEVAEIAGKGGAEHLQVGDSVFGLTYGGAYAEYVKVPASMIWKKDPRMSWEYAAAIPEAFLTAFQALHTISNLQQGEDVLIHAGASGVGTAAIQLARFMGANKVYTTVGTDEKIEHCKKLGATDGFNYKTQNWSEELKRVSNGTGVNVIMDFIAAPYFQANVASLRPDGRMTIQAILGGAKLPEGVNIAPLLFKRLRIEGTTLRARSVAYQSDLAKSFADLGCIEALGRGAEGAKSDNAMSVVLYKTWDWTQIKDAHDTMEANENTGKMVAVVS